MNDYVYTKVMDVLTKDSVKKKWEAFLNYILKYRFIILFIFFLYFDADIYLLFVNNKSDYIGLMCIFVIAGIVLSVMVYAKVMKECFYCRRSFLYCLLYFVMILHSGSYEKNYASTISIVGLSLISIIVFYGRRYVFLIPLICFILNILSPGFYTDFFISIMVICYFSDNIHVIRSSVFWKKMFLYITGILFYFVSVILDYVCNIGDIISFSMVWQLFNDYFHFGFTARGLFATIRYIFVGEEGSFYKSFNFVLCFQIIGLLCLFLLIYVLWIESKDNCYAKMICIAMLCSETVRNIADAEMFVYFDIWMICGLTACVIFLLRNNKYILIPIIMAILMLVHHGFGIFLFPTFCVIFFYYCLTKEKVEVKTWIVFIIALAMVVLLFGYFHFFSHLYVKIPFKDACEYVAGYIGRKVPDKIELLSSKELFDNNGVLFLNIKYILYNGKITDFGIQIINSASIYNSVLLFLLLSPLYYIIVSNFKVFKGRNGIYGLIAKTAPFVLIIFLASYLEVDYGRWNGFYIFSLILILLFSIIIDSDKSWIQQIPEKYRKLVCEVIIALMIAIPNMGVWAN